MSKTRKTSGKKLKNDILTVFTPYFTSVSVFKSSFDKYRYWKIEMRNRGSGA